MVASDGVLSLNACMNSLGGVGQAGRKRLFSLLSGDDSAGEPSEVPAEAASSAGGPDEGKKGKPKAWPANE
eukprot:10862019-Alexandrium_andersonii.AAC.1